MASCCYLSSDLFEVADGADLESGPVLNRYVGCQIMGLVAYGEASPSEGGSEAPITNVEVGAAAAPLIDLPVIQAAPAVDTFGVGKAGNVFDMRQKQILTNPRADHLFRPIEGPQLPHEKAGGGLAKGYRNHLSGHVEACSFSAAAFNEQYQSYRSTGVALDPSDWERAEKRPLGAQSGFTAATASLAEIQALDELRSILPPDSKRQRPTRDVNWNPAESDYKGPWAQYASILPDISLLPGATNTSSGDDDADGDREEKLDAKDGTKDESAEAVPAEPVEVVTTIFHGTKLTDYQGNSWLTPPKSVKIVEDPEDLECLLPRKLLHTYVGHTMGVHAIRFIPKSGHMLLSASMDSKVRLWDCYNQRKCMRTYMGHSMAVRDIQFTSDGSRFYSCSYDKNILLWDTEYGKVIGTFTNGKTPYCVSVHPDPAQQNDFIIGSANKRAVEFDATSGKIVQEYNEHLAAVNTVTFCDESRKIITTSDDKKMFIWEHGIPVVVKHISEPHMHSMPAVRLHPTGKFIAAQSMDNKIVVYEALGRFRFQGRKCFRGHMNAGYAIQPEFSPDGQYLVSGDASGKLWFWEWRNMKNCRTLRGHDGVCICSAWHPFLPSRVATCGWDGSIKLWN